MARLFFALLPPEDVRQALVAVQADVLPGRARAIPPANLHLTLAFLGEVDEPARTALRQQAPASLAPFSFALSELGLWRRSGIAWLGPAAPVAALTGLAGRLAAAGEAVGIPAECRDFRAHVTLARRCPRLPARGPVPAIHWPVHDYALMASTATAGGVLYTPLQRWPLAPDPR